MSLLFTKYLTIAYALICELSPGLTYLGSNRQVVALFTNFMIY